MFHVLFLEEEAKKKWKNLKDKYRKLIQKPPLKSGSGAVSTKNKWRFFDIMNFTNDTVIPAKMIGNLSIPETPISSPEMLEQSLDMEDEEENDEPPIYPIIRTVDAASVPKKTFKHDYYFKLCQTSSCQVSNVCKK